MKPFPDDFLFGATIGSHQVEGGDFNSDWWRWEQRASRISNGDTSERGAGHLERYRQDLALARKLGHNAVYLSLSWPRIHADADRFDGDALTHYRRVLEYADELGLVAVCALHETTVPNWFRERGGWRCDDAARHFANYVRQTVEVLGGLCRYWIPVHEPEHYLTMVYREKTWPGGEKGRGAYRQASRQLATAQLLAARLLWEKDPNAEIGLSVRGASVEPLDKHSPWDLRAAIREEERLNRRFVEETLSLATGTDEDKAFDFIGLSYFGGLRVRFAPLYFRGAWALPVDDSEQACSVHDARAHPCGLEETLLGLATYGAPILLTGVGVAAASDQERCLFLLELAPALQNALHALEGKVDVRALFYHSLLDGFEWRRGYSQRRGLIHVEYPKLERTPNDSAWLFKDIAEHGCVRPGTVQRFRKAEQG